jgi:hypothetical protein
VMLLRDHAPALLDSLQAALAARAARGRTSSQVGGSGGGVANRGGTAGAMAGGAAGRELAVLKRLGPLLGRAWQMLPLTSSHVIPAFLVSNFLLSPLPSLLSPLSSLLSPLSSLST